LGIKRLIVIGKSETFILSGQLQPMKILFLTSAAPTKAGFKTSEKRPPLGMAFLMAILKERGVGVFFSDEYFKVYKKRWFSR